MPIKLLCQAVLKFLLGALLVGLLLFLPAGSLDYWQAWLFMGILFIPMFCAGIVMMFANPDLLKKRLNVREEQPEQKQVIALSGLIFIAGFVIAGLNYRFNWIALPDWVSWAGAVVFLVAYALYGEVMRENAFLSRTIEVQEGQRVVDTGLYGIVRHPMYSVTIVLFLAIPFVLGSPLTFIVFLTYPIAIAKRVRNEEAVLEEGLPGYREYEQKVKYRILPLIW